MLFRYINHDTENRRERQPAPTVSKWPEEKVKKCREMSDIEMDLSMNGVYIEFSNVNLYKPNKDGPIEHHVLNNVNGYVEPGDLVALMGPSGAGKTSLLDVLANKINDGRITGEILINGKERNRYFRRIAGYVEQFNSHMECLSVREALTFAADLRMNPRKNNAAARKRAVEDILRKLDIAHLGNERIGNDKVGISAEAKKKLTIAVELVGRPGLLFLDEPTTGLDSSAAINVMRIVRALAHQGQAVICTVHQPPREAYNYFDRILLLQAGGSTAYFGDCEKLNAYFEHAGAGSMEPGKNPADWAIEAIATFDTNETWIQSKELIELVQKLENTVCPENHREESFTSAHATSTKRQCNVLFYRSLRFFWRDTLNLKMRFISAFVISLGFGMLYWNITKMEGDFKTIAFLSIFFVTTVYCTESAAQEVPILIGERATFYREIDSNLYKVLPYYTARVMAQQTMLIIQAILFAVPLFFMSLWSYERKFGGVNEACERAQRWMDMFFYTFLV